MLDVRLSTVLFCFKLTAPLPLLAVALTVLCGADVRAQGQYPRTIAYVSPATATVATVSVEQVRQQAQQAYQSTQFEQSLSCYRQVVASGSASAADYYWLAESHSQLGQFASAAQALQEAIKLDGSNDLLKVRLVQSHFAARDRGAAQDACHKALGSVRDGRAREQLAMLLKVMQLPEPEPVRGKMTDAGAMSTER
ncbi:MAG: Tetratricopeptide repeat protein [Cyanobacteriota bacterium erpe_2018_sw_39hr_WHONDRS-SW48-000098_B_bin.30]|nr:Tetratricopeptide repeat protein [Cyanobacteriota bacterium erpe_2018_sw_39hr_WHONDRS-SW48-000098_B_bin.30]